MTARHVVLPHASRVLFSALLVASISILGACNSAPSDQKVKEISEQPAKPEERIAKQRTVLPPGTPAASQATFSTPDDAVKALLLACESKDHAEMHKIFGPAAHDFVSDDPVEDANDFNDFAEATTQRAVLEEKPPNIAILHIGNKDWAFPIPITKTNDGKWYFDTVAGESEILARRIGENELEAIALCRTYVDAQREYASVDRNGDGVLEYAQRLSSALGKHDGLYWPADNSNSTTDHSNGRADAGPSPFGPLVANAESEGYAPISGSRRAPTAYHGYYFHILKSQGAAAPGGAYNYIINGHMIAGFGLVASPSEYGKSGVMTFIVSHQGKVYQKDLGAHTEDLAQKMTQYNPDNSWTLVKE